MTKSDLMRKMHRAGLRIQESAIATKKPDAVQQARRKGARR